MRKIILDYHKDKELFNKTAQEWAGAINRTKKTQIRNYYDKILELEKRSKENFEDTIPFIKMLNSKVAYGVSRNVVSSQFQDMMKQCISQIDTENDKKKFDNFKLFFEAVLGFFKGRD